MMKKLIKIFGLTLLTLVLLVGTASALSTYINPLGGGDGHEQSLTAPGGILDSLYGLSNLTRVDDSLDQVWQVCTGSNCGQATYQAKYASYSQNIGISATDGTGKTAIFSSTSGAIGTTYTFTSSTIQFLFYDNPNKGATTWYSLMPLNGGEDHMVTYKINSEDCAYVIAFEDMTFGTSDQDYNDIVIEVRNVHPAPEPATMLLLGLGLVGAAAIRRKMK